MINSIVVFVPSFLNECNNTKLLGVVNDCDRNIIFYITEDEAGEINDRNSELRIIGQYFGNADLITKNYEKHSDAWITFGKYKENYIIHKIKWAGKVIDTTKCNITIINYNDVKFTSAELLLRTNCNENSINYFTDLCSLLRHKVLKNYEKKRRFYLLFEVLSIISLITSCINSSVLKKVNNVIGKYSSIVQHFYFQISYFNAILKEIMSKKKITLKAGNYFMSSLVDVFCAALVMEILFPLLIEDLTFPEYIIEKAEAVVSTLEKLLHWLMGIPAGLKLNYALNNMLGSFFLYHINLWWTFLVVTKPLLEITIQALIWLGTLGITFQVSILADILSLVSFHIYCIYVFAARLYSLQLLGLKALLRLFLGRKYNPLRQKYDSCLFSPEQLFVGTLAFTILLFLFPTTVVYYAVFSVLRLIVVSLRGILSWIIYAVQSLPLYTTILWLLRSPKICSSVHLSVKCPTSIEEPLILNAEPFAESIWKTVGYTKQLDVISPQVEWKEIFICLIQGHLIYPI